jgi:hypothetical protein
MKLRRSLHGLVLGSVLLLTPWAAVSVVGASPIAATADAAKPPPNVFVPTGAMSTARAGHTATLLPDGEVLVTGGGTSRAELFDPSTGAFTPTGSMSVARTNATATLLPDGHVLVAGGCCLDPTHGLTSAELYDPASGTWTPTGSMHSGRFGDTATLLPDGDVLVAGGACNGQNYGCDAGSSLVNQSSAELYDPSTGIWTATGSMHDGRELQTATLLDNGRVLVTGGFNSCDDDFCSDLSSAELYNPATGRWRLTGSMHAAREQHSATLLDNGRVLVAGGLNEGGFGRGSRYSSAELYDPVTGTWAVAASMAQVHVGQTATLLHNGSVLVAGGGTSVAELYEPGPGIWVSPAALSTVRTDQTATLLPDGEVLVAGGDGPDGAPLATAELYTAGRGPLVTIAPGVLTFGTQQVGSASSPQSITVTNRGSSNLIVSGIDVSGPHPSDFATTSDCAGAVLSPGGSCNVSTRFVPVATGPRSATVAVADNAPLSPQGASVSGYGNGPDVWTPTGSLTTPRDSATATLLANGEVLVAGGQDPITNSLASAELYDPGTGSFTPTATMDEPRASATAVRLTDGDVLVAGGYLSDFVRLASAELYHPSTGTWTLTGSMNEAGSSLTSTLLPSGDVLVTGFNGPGQLYDPTTGTWSNTGPLASPEGFGATATLLGDGDVLVANDGASTQLYDPRTNTWASTGSLHVARQGGTATRLADGKVLVAGGDPPGGGVALTDAELYDPSTGQWTETGPMFTGLFGETATLLGDGTVMVAGGCTGGCDNRPAESATELFSGGFWSLGPPMTHSRVFHTATLLASGDLLVVGGDGRYGGSALGTAEVYTPVLLTVTPRSGPVGQQIDLVGNGFYAGELVTVTWGGGTRIAQATTAADGTFAVKAVVPPSTVGRHSIRAVGARSPVGATTTFDVTT